MSLLGEINHVLFGGDKSCPHWGEIDHVRR